MEILEYGNAQRLGKKQYQDDLAREVSPYLPVLDEILENADINAQYAIDTGYTPSTYSATNSDTYQAYVNNVFPDVKRLLDAQNATPENIGYALSPVQSEAQSHFVTILNNMYYDSSYTAEKAMKTFSDQCNESLELYRITQGLE